MCALQEVWGGTEEDSRAIVDGYIESSYFSQPVVSGAVEGAAPLQPSPSLRSVLTRAQELLL